MLSLVTLSAAFLIATPRIVMLSVFMLSVVILSVVILSAVAPISNDATATCQSYKTFFSS